MSRGHIAILTTECFASSDAVKRLASRLGRRVALLVVSHPDQETSLPSQVRTHLRRSGPRFLQFLLANFSIYELLTGPLGRSAARLARRSPPESLAAFCKSRGIGHVVTQDVNDLATRRAIADAKIDTIVVLYFDKILGLDLLDAVPGGALNVHGALLPEYRGLFPEIWALGSGESEVGVTVHRIVDRGIDSGPIIAQARKPVTPGMTALDLSYDVNIAGAELVADLLDGDGVLGAVEQQAGSYFSYPSPEAMRRLVARGHRPASFLRVIRAMLA